MNTKAERLREARVSAGFSSTTAAAARMGINASTYRAHENGQNDFDDEHAKLYAKTFKTTPGRLMFDENVPVPIDGVRGPIGLSEGRPYYGGVVRAGEFLPVDDDFNQDAGDHLVPLGVMPHPAYAHMQQGAWLVSGSSMNEAGVLDGMWVVGPSYADWIDKYGELGNGNLVVVERSRKGGSERELTVKEVQFARRGMRLVPRSSDPKYQEFFIPLDEEADSDTETVRVLAVVLWFGRDIDPRTKR